MGASGSSAAASLVGTFHYMPPEVRDGGDWSPQRDVYSLGVMAPGQYARYLLHSSRANRAG